MKSFIKNKCLMVLVFAGFISSCEQDQLGPDNKSVSKNFDVSKVILKTDGSDLINRIDVAPLINADWGEEASYELSIRGLQSGAVKTYSGMASKFDTLWIGFSSNKYFFKETEYASIHLKLSGVEQEVVSKDTIYIKDAFDFNGQTIDGIKYYVAETFDKSEENITAYPVQTIADDKKDKDVVFTFTEDLAIEGSTCLLMSGYDFSGNGWNGDITTKYSGDLLTKANSDDYPIDSGIDPSDLFFNIFIYGAGAQGTTVTIQTFEIDKGDSIDINSRKEINDWIIAGNENQSLYDGSINDAWLFDVQVKWEGWKLVSIPYSEFRAKNSMTGGGNGDRVKESHRISGLGVSLQSYPTAGLKTKAYVDFLTITTGGKANYN
jgi:hypothetical protein